MTPAVTTNHTPVRDRVTWISYVQISFFAWFMYSFGATQALLRDEQGTGLVLASLHGTFLSIGGLLAAVSVARLMLRYGRGRVLRLGSIGTIIGVLILTWPGVSIGVTFLGVFLAGIFGTFIVATVNAFLLDHEGLAGPAALTEANALACFAGLLGPLVIGIGAATLLGWRAGMYVVILALIAVEIWRGRNTEAFSEPPEIVARYRGHFGGHGYYSFALSVLSSPLLSGARIYYARDAGSGPPLLRHRWPRLSAGCSLAEPSALASRAPLTLSRSCAWPWHVHLLPSPSLGHLLGGPSLFSGYSSPVSASPCTGP